MARKEDVYMRQANSTIKGYLYQFNKSILEILSADDEASITLEGVIEDIDIQLPNATSTIQCKYHEDAKFTMSSVAAPILEMICHYNECVALGKSTKYILFAHYAENVDQIDTDAFEKHISSTTSKELQLSYFHKIYTIPDASILNLANKPKKSKEDKTKILDYYTSNRPLRLCLDLSKFWECFEYVQAEEFEELKDKVIEKLCEQTDRQTAEDLYYPNAFSMVANLSSESEISNRTVDKQSFIEELKSKETVLITKWMLAGLDRKKILQAKKMHLSASFSLNTAIRAFVFSERFHTSNEEQIIPFIQEYIAKYYKKKALQRPPLFVFENGSDIIQKVILGLHKYQKAVNSGLVGNVFMPDSFVNNTDCSSEFVCKIASLENITTTIFESCNVNQLYIIGDVSAELSSSNYYTEQIEIEELNVLRYLVNLERNLEVS
ncbi:MAG: hypothetical protein IJZ51_06155 [Ruminiclostridium sp.]|nr:hypothetical protein [Ruminiclostridium sp.]